MENPTEEIEAVIYKLTTGSPRLQQQTLQHYFTPNASFLHPFCAVNGSRSQILSIFKWYKVLSPEITIKVNGISSEPARQKLYVDITQTFRIWPLIPLGYSATVNLVTVLQLTRDPSGHDPAAERAVVKSSSPTPAFGSNALTASHKSPFNPDGSEKAPTTLPSLTETREVAAKYWIKSQNDLYQTTEFTKFISLFGLLPIIVQLWQMLATWACVVGALVSSPFTHAMQRWSDQQVEHRARVRSFSSVGPSSGADGMVDDKSQGSTLKERDVWELEARFLGGGVVAAEGKMEGLKMKMKTSLKMEAEGKRNREGRAPVLDWMKMERSL